MTEDQRQRLDAILDAHDQAIAAMRAVNEQVDVANQAFSVMVRQHDTAIEAALNANRAALALLRSMQTDG